MKSLLLIVALLFVHAPSVYAQPPTSTPAATVVTVAPPDVKEVIAEGRAAIGEGGVLAARRAAQAQALRSAVEKTTGVYVSARTLTQNYQMVRDQVVLRAEGFATLKEVVKETVLPDEVRVTVRALVSLKPLAEQLKALNLTRAWRVSVVGEGSSHAKFAPQIASATALLERTLADAGFVVVSDHKNTDVTVRVSPRFTTVSETRLTTAAGPMTMHSVRSDFSVRATRAGTGEVVAALSCADTALHIDLATARAQAAEGATETLAPRLAEALLILPARDSQPITLTISGLATAARVGKVEDALNALTGIRGVQRRSYARGLATWELEVLTDALPLLPRLLENDPLVRPFRLAVSAETRSRITAASKPVAPPKRRRR